MAEEQLVHATSVAGWQAVKFALQGKKQMNATVVSICQLSPAHVCTCRISSRPRTAVLTSSTADSAVGSRSEISRGPEHTRERPATCTEEEGEKKNTIPLQLEARPSSLLFVSEVRTACTRSMMSSRLLK